MKHNREDKLIARINELERLVSRLKEENSRLSKAHSDASWANEGRRDYEQEERSKWGIFG